MVSTPDRTVSGNLDAILGKLVRVAYYFRCLVVSPSCAGYQKTQVLMVFSLGFFVSYIDIGIIC
jgi:hypothetical protein